MAILASEIEAAISTAFPQAQFTLQDLVGDQDHYSLEIYIPQFHGLSRIAQHRAIYAALQDNLGAMPHALTIQIKQQEL